MNAKEHGPVRKDTGAEGGGHAAVKGVKSPLRVLVDTGANASYVSQSYVDTLPRVTLCKNSLWLQLANGSNNVSEGTCVLPLHIQSYSGTVECFVLPLSFHFDSILGDDWCELVSAGATLQIVCMSVGLLSLILAGCKSPVMLLDCSEAIRTIAHTCCQ